MVPMRHSASFTSGRATDTSLRPAGDVAKIEALLLTQPAGDPFGWASPDPPLFLKVARFREGVHRLNSVLVGYAGLLGSLPLPTSLALRNSNSSRRT